MEHELTLFPINLQLFADDEDDIDDVGEDELDLEDDIEDTNEPIEGEDGEEDDIIPPTTQPKDKITHALIKQKQANKELKQRLEYFELQEKEKQLLDKRKLVADKLIEKGYDEEYALSEADKHIETESIKETVKKLEFLTENADIIAKYPAAKKNINKLIQLQKNTGWDIEKICQIEYALNESDYDSKIKNEQEAQLRKKKRTPTPTGGQTPIQSIKLDSEDERAYQFYAKKNPGVSRKQYADRLNNNVQKIPHDKWD